MEMCRICLVKDVRMYAVVNKNLHQLYERLTDVPFVTEDSRPMLACFFCCAKLKQCWRFQRKCLEAEELFTQMMSENYKQDTSRNLGQFSNGFSVSPIELMSIVDDGQTESDAIKKESPDVSEELDVNDLEVEQHTDELKLKNIDENCSDVNDLHHAESDYKYEVPLMEIKTEVDEEQDPSGMSFEEKPNIDAQQNPIKQEKPDPEKLFKCDICQRTFTYKNSLVTHTRTHTGEKPYKCNICQRSFAQSSNLLVHTRMHTGERPYKCGICQRSFAQKRSLDTHIHTHNQTHNRTYTGNKKFKCKICQIRFSRKSHLESHVIIHSSFKSYHYKW